MESKPVERNFFKYIFTSMITMLLHSLYSIVDSLFISNLVGDKGLSAVYVVWPILAVIIALGTGIGCGGAVIMSTKQGEGKFDESDTVRANIIMLLSAASIITTIVASLSLPSLLKLMGADGELMEYALVYGKTMVLGCAVQIFSAGLTPVLRNDNKVVTAMSIMIAGMICNVVLVYTFIYKLNLGIQGAAMATLSSQLLTVICCVIALLRNKIRPIKLSQFKLKKGLIKKIIQIGISPFGISLTPSLLILYNNVQCIKYGGDTGIAIFSVISATIGAYRVILIGVAEGIQPLASIAAGAKDYDFMMRIRRNGILAAVSTSVFLFLFTLVTARFYPAMFGLSKEIAAQALWPILICSTQLVFTGLVRVTNSFFYAVGKVKYSYFMIYFDPLVMTPILLFILPRLFGMNGIWISTTISQLILNIVAVGMYKKHNQEIKFLKEGSIELSTTKMMREVRNDAG